MKRIVLIACASRKRAEPCKARDLYVSPLFKKNLRYAERLDPDRIFILSAKYGLVDLEDEIEPYNWTLNSMPADEVKFWARQVIEQLSKRADLQQDQFVFLAGMKYRKYLIPHLAHVEVPFEGLTIGKQLRRLSE
jgi:cytoplasmic iron level regulating protein YaaA (DUF328/UPF0246 family)